MKTKAKSDRLKAIQDDIRAALIDYMDRQQTTLFEKNGVKINLSRAPRNVFNTRQFAKDHAKLYGQYQMEQTCVQMRITGI